MASAEPNRYIPVFVENDQELIFIQQLGVGFQGQAQLVQHAQSGQYLVRKISRIGESQRDLDAGESLGLQETEMLEYLHAAEHNEFEEWFETVFLNAAEHQYREKSAADGRGEAWLGITFPAAEDPAVLPSSNVDTQAIIAFLTEQIMPAADAVRAEIGLNENVPQGAEHQHHIIPQLGRFHLPLPFEARHFPEEPLTMMVTYLEFADGGDVTRFGPLTRDSPTPLSIVLRYLAHVTHALKFMYDRSVRHGDVEDKNVFMSFWPSNELNEPIFHLGDFGMSSSIEGEEEDTPYFTMDIQYLLRKLETLHLQEPENETVAELLREMQAVYDYDTTHEGATGLPDLTTFLTLINQAAVEFPVTQDDISRIPGPLVIRPTFYNSVEACSVANVVGTFRVGTVRLDADGAIEGLDNIGEDVCYPAYFPPMN